MSYSYVILSSESPDKLAEEITRRINVGWECQGGVAVYVDRVYPHSKAKVPKFIQAMIVPGLRPPPKKP